MCHTSLVRRYPPLAGWRHPTRSLGDQAEALGLLDRLGAVAHVELAIQRGRVLLDGVGQRNSVPAISRLVAPEAIASSTSRSRSESGGPAGASCGLKTVMPRPTIRTAPAMSAAGQSLEMKPDAPAARAAFGADPAGAGDQQDVQARAEREQLRADLRARLLADEQVHERDVRVVAARERERLLRCCARTGSAPPTAARRASAAGPSARPRGRRPRARAACGRCCRRRSGSG